MITRSIVLQPYVVRFGGSHVWGRLMVLRHVSDSQHGCIPRQNYEILLLNAHMCFHV